MYNKIRPPRCDADHSIDLAGIGHRGLRRRGLERTKQAQFIGSMANAAARVCLAEGDRLAQIFGPSAAIGRGCYRGASSSPQGARSPGSRLGVFAHGVSVEEENMKEAVVAPRMTSAVVALSVCIISSTAGAEDAMRSLRDASRFTYTRLYCAPDNQSHFGALTVELAKQNFAPPAALIYIGGNQQASSVFLGGFEAHWGAADLANHLYHPTPAVQFITVVEGAFSITTTDGETRELHPGDMVRLEDVAPCLGHITVAGDRVGFLLFAR
jgi:hypothetical protein